MHDLLYENQKEWKDVFDVRPIFAGYAQRIGLDVEKWKADQDGETVARRITLDGSRGHSLGIKGTPTLFINNREIPFEQVTAEGLRAAIDKALNGGQ
jgi:predicted DsbA family dithiol-disulfide isomerase